MKNPKNNNKQILLITSLLLIFTLQDCKIWPVDTKSSPSKPIEPIGMEYGVDSVIYIFKTVAFDPDGDQLVYQFKIDETIYPAEGVWSSYYPSGDTLCFITYFEFSKIYSIQARVRDEQQNISDWSEPHYIQIIVPDVHLYSVRFVNPALGWVAGEEATILKTTNGGVTWYPQASEAVSLLEDIYFISESIGWIVGGVYIEGRVEFGEILKTTNGGVDWSIQTREEYLYSVFFKSENIGWAVGRHGLILKTTNGGVDWPTQLKGPSYDVLFSVYFTSENTGWAVGRYGSIHKTTDGGVNWYTQPMATESWLLSVYFASDTTGWAVGGAGEILKTTNGGDYWFHQPSGTSNVLFSIYFTSETTGWAVGEGGIILKTTNGGVDWSAQSSGTTNSLLSVYFISENIGWAVGRFGTVLKTTDSGITWIQQFIMGEYRDTSIPSTALDNIPLIGNEKN